MMPWIDAAVHPAMASPDDIRNYLEEPWRRRAILPAERYEYPVPGGEFLATAKPHAGAAGSDPELLARDVGLSDRLRTAVLIPYARGLSPDLNLSAAICSALNDWLAANWLGQQNVKGRYLGSIRVDPRDPVAAVAEIERWAGDRRMGQVVVPLESHHPYGQRQFDPIWIAAAAHRLPVAIMAEGGGGIELQPTMAGYVSHFAEYGVLGPLASFHHLISFIVEGVLERVPELRLVFVDGGSDVLMPILWRLDKDWRGIRFETPWVRKFPTEYVFDRCFFCINRMEGPTTEDGLADWYDMSEVARLCLYASRYPRWDHCPAHTASAALPVTVKDRVMNTNARRLYQLGDEASDGS
jgi:predicted TIM-barrel fold metal-dependent hydrolase